MNIRCLLTKEEVTQALVDLALKKRGAEIPAGAHQVRATLLTFHDATGAITQARVEVELPEVVG